MRKIRKNIPVFESCMEELKRNMLICGHPDYEQEIRELLTLPMKGNHYRRLFDYWWTWY